MACATAVKIISMCFKQAWQWALYFAECNQYKVLCGLACAQEKKRFEMIERVYAERFCQSMADSNFANACSKVCIFQFD